MNDDDQAKKLLKLISELALMQYPYNDSTNVVGTRALALGYIAGIALAAAKDPPEFNV
jgi:hypothetical protein